MKKVSVFDLDNTLIFTDDLNNDSYRYAMNILGLHISTGEKRTTKREVIEFYPFLSKRELDVLKNLKMRYYRSNLNQTELNIGLLKHLKTLDNHKIVLWTAANEDRAKLLLIEYGLGEYFNLFFYSDKKDVCKDIDKICRYFNIEKKELSVYEDNDYVIEQLRNYDVMVTDVKGIKY